MHSKQKKVPGNTTGSGNNLVQRKKKGTAAVIADNRVEALQFKQILDLVDSSPGTTAPIQFVQPKPLAELLADRAGKNTEHGQETRDEINQVVDPRAVDLSIYRQARDNNLDAQQLPGLNRNQNAAVPNVIVIIQAAVREARASRKGEAAEAKVFKRSFSKMVDGPDEIARVARYFYLNALNKAKAEEYLAQLVHEEQHFDLGFAGDEEVQYETPKAGLLGPGQSELDIGTSIANQVLKEAFQSETQEEIYFRLAVAIGETMNSPNVSLDIASRILEDYLKPKILDFIYRLPLAEQAEDEDVWGGRSLNDGIVDAEGNEFDEEDTWIRPKVRDAWTQIRSIVSPAVLNHAGEVYVQVDGLFSRAGQKDGVLHLGKYRATKGMIMHEFGHHLENNSEAPHWIKLQQLLRDRSRGKELKRIFPFTIPYVISRDEMRYDTDLPASGVMGGYFNYNVKYYDYGSTEVVSTAFEVFHDRKKAYTIAIKDPEMFLAVMGVLRGK